jgi:uncharacterized protein (TIGR02452 family)
MKKKITKKIENDIQNNIKLWKSTCKQMDNYKIVSSVKEELSADEVVENTYDELFVKVFHENIMDTLEAAIAQEFTPMLVNSANAQHPLDALKTGASGQEYDILRRTNYYNTITDEMFPIKETGAIYSPEVYLFKSSDNRTCPKAKKFSMLTLCPLRNPKLISIRTDGNMQDTYKEKHEETLAGDKIRLIFDTALKYNHDCIILPDFGCGKENNPLDITVRFFNENIRRSAVKYVFFSIKNENNMSRDGQFLYFHKNILRSVEN